MNLGTETGSVMNHLMSRMVRGEPAPRVGMGATLLSWTDRHAATVTTGIYVPKHGTWHIQHGSGGEPTAIRSASSGTASARAASSGAANARTARSAAARAARVAGARTGRSAVVEQTTKLRECPCIQERVGSIYPIPGCQSARNCCHEQWKMCCGVGQWSCPRSFASGGE